MRYFFTVTAMFAINISAASAAQPEPSVLAYKAAMAAPTSFNPEEFKKYEEVGKSSIKGSTWVSNARGFRQILPNTTIYILPSTAFTNTMYQLGHLISSNSITEPQLQKFIKKTTTDANGAFEFHDLAAGAYTLEMAVKANPNSQKFNSSSDKIVLLRIVLAENEAKTVRLGN